MSMSSSQTYHKDQHSRDSSGMTHASFTTGPQTMCRAPFVRSCAGARELTGAVISDNRIGDSFAHGRAFPYNASCLQAWQHLSARYTPPLEVIRWTSRSGPSKSIATGGLARNGLHLGAPPAPQKIAKHVLEHSDERHGKGQQSSLSPAALPGHWTLGRGTLQNVDPSATSSFARTRQATLFKLVRWMRGCQLPPRSGIARRLALHQAVVAQPSHQMTLCQHQTAFAVPCLACLPPIVMTNWPP